MSCSYDFTKYNDEGGEENGIPYDIEFLDGEFAHLAIVDNPRYERANIVFNSKTAKGKEMEDYTLDNAKDRDGQEGEWITVKGTHVFIPKGQSQEEVVQKFLESKKGENKEKPQWLKDAEKKLDRQTTQMYEDRYGYEEGEDGELHPKKSDGGSGKKETKERESVTSYKKHIDRIGKLIKSYKLLEPHEQEGALEDLNDFERQFAKNLEPRQEEALTEKLLDFEDDLKRYYGAKHGEEVKQGTLDRIKEMQEETGWYGDKTLNRIKKDLTFTSYSKFDDVEKLATELAEYEKQYYKTVKSFDDKPKKKADNSKEQDMAIIEELKKLITKVENDKGDKDMVNNEKEDKRKLIDEVGGILKGKVDDEIIRTIIKKMEEASYNESEAGSADNKKVKNEADEEDKKDEEKVENKKVKNEETEEDKEKVEELKEDEKKDVENKCNNSKETFFDKMNKIYNSSVAQSKNDSYVSRADRLKAGEDYFKV